MLNMEKGTQKGCGNANRFEAYKTIINGQEKKYIDSIHTVILGWMPYMLNLNFKSSDINLTITILYILLIYIYIYIYI